MGLFDFLFNKKEVEEVQEVEIIEEKELEGDNEVQGLCDYCHNDIKTDEKMKKFSKQTFHKKCFKKFMRSAERFAFGQ